MSFSRYVFTSNVLDLLCRCLVMLNMGTAVSQGFLTLNLMVSWLVWNVKFSGNSRVMCL